MDANTGTETDKADVDVVVDIQSESRALVVDNPDQTMAATAEMRCLYRYRWCT